MQVSIKSFNVEMSVKNKGIEFEIYDNGGDFLGDIIITKTGLEWCQGKTRVGNGVKVTWKKFIAMMNPE